MREYPSKRPDLRLFVRALQSSDWEALYAIREQDNVRPNILSIPFSDPIQFKEFFAHSHEGAHRLTAEAVLSHGESVIVGNLGLFRGRLGGADRADLGLQVHQDYHNVGVGSALMAAMCDLADNWLNLHRVELEVFTDNAGGIALYKKFGFEIEATCRLFAFRDGAYGDCHIMGRLHPQPEAAHTPASGVVAS